MNLPTVSQVPQWMDYFEEGLKQCLRGVKRQPFFIPFSKI